MAISGFEAHHFRVQSVVQDAFQWQDGRYRQLIGLSLVMGTVTFTLLDLFDYLPWVGVVIHVAALSAVFIMVVRHRFQDEATGIFYPLRVLRIAGWFVLPVLVAGELFTRLVLPLAQLQIPDIEIIGFGLTAVLIGSYTFARAVPKLAAVSLGYQRSFLKCIGTSKGAGFRIIYGTLLVAVLPLTAILLNAAVLYLLTGSSIGAGLGFLIVLLQWFGNVLYIALLASMAAFEAEAFERLRDINGEEDRWAADER